MFPVLRRIVALRNEKPGICMPFSCSRSRSILNLTGSHSRTRNYTGGHRLRTQGKRIVLSFASRCVLQQEQSP